MHVPFSCTLGSDSKLRDCEYIPGISLFWDITLDSDGYCVLSVEQSFLWKFIPVQYTASVNGKE